MSGAAEKSEWSFSDFEPRPSQVRSSLNNGHVATASACRFRAIKTMVPLGYLDHARLQRDEALTEARQLLPINLVAGALMRSPRQYSFQPDAAHPAA